MAGPYRVILADPPWTYRVHKPGAVYRNPRTGTHVAPDYELMPLDAIKALPVADMAAKDCALFLWATMPCLPEAFEVMHAWGFAYKTVAFAWVKTNKTTGNYHLGLGHYTRGNAELCLLGIRGRMERKAANVSQIIAAHRREHSRKPDEAYAAIMRLFDGPYLEMFARQQWPGWDVWGNETGKYVVLGGEYAG